MWTQFNDQKRWSLPLKPASQPKGSKGKVWFMPVRDSFTFVLAQVLKKSQHEAQIRALTFYLRDRSLKQGEWGKKGEGGKEISHKSNGTGHITAPATSLQWAAKRLSRFLRRCACSLFCQTFRKGAEPKIHLDIAQRTEEEHPHPGCLWPPRLELPSADSSPPYFLVPFGSAAVTHEVKGHLCTCSIKFRRGGRRGLSGG